MARQLPGSTVSARRAGAVCGAGGSVASWPVNAAEVVRRTVAAMTTATNVPPEPAPGANEPPERLSPSRAKDYMQCPKLFYFKTVLGIREPGTEATLRGTIAHAAFERIFDHEPGNRGVEQILPYVEPALAMLLEPLVPREQVTEGTPQWRLRAAEQRFREDHAPGSRSEQRLLREADEVRSILDELDEEAFLETVRQVVRGWYGMESPHKFTPDARELHVAAKIAGVTVHGFIDRLDKITGADGIERVYVTDYKTGKRVRPKYEDEAFFQLAVYALLLRESAGIDVTQLRLVFTKVGDPSGVVTRTVDQQLLTKTRKQLTAVWNAIGKSYRTDDWPTRRQPLCGWCYFQEVCPEFNPELEGLLPEELERQLAGESGPSAGEQVV